MIRDVTIRENNFLLIFSDAVLLYEAAMACDNDDLNSALAKSSVLAVNFAIEAAANSFLQSVELTTPLKDSIDKFPTIDKFNFVLQWHTDNHLPKGDSHVQAVSNLVKNRNAMVHPKVVKRSLSVETQVGPDGRLLHSVITSPPRKGQDVKHKLLGPDPELYTHHDAKAALQVMTKFLNAFVYWWGIGYDDAELFLFQTWDGSLSARPVMFRKNQIDVLVRNDHFLNIQFMGIHGMFDDDNPQI